MLNKLLEKNETYLVIKNTKEMTIQLPKNAKDGLILMFMLECNNRVILVGEHQEFCFEEAFQTLILSYRKGHWNIIMGETCAE